MDILKKDVDIFIHIHIFFNISTSLNLVLKSLSRLKSSHLLRISQKTTYKVPKLIKVACLTHYPYILVLFNWAWLSSTLILHSLKTINLVKVVSKTVHFLWMKSFQFMFLVRHTVHLYVQTDEKVYYLFKQNKVCLNWKRLSHR